MTNKTKLLEQINYQWPSLGSIKEQPIWTGQGFQVGDKIVPVLAYEVGVSGWTDELTDFHEDTADSNHFIDVASRQHAVEQLQKYITQPNSCILEVGCSSGFMLQAIRQTMPQAFVIGSDYVRQPLEHLAAQVPDIPLLQFNLLECPLPDASVDAIVLLNVLEHIKNDEAALLQLYRILKPGGVLVLEVPAGPKLYDVYDKLLMHFRRYARPQIVKLARKSGFNVVEQSHLGVFIYPPFWLVKQRNKRFLSEGEAVQKQIVAKNITSTGQNPLLKLAMQFELKLGKVVSYPFGIRCLLTCQKEQK